MPCDVPAIRALITRCPRCSRSPIISSVSATSPTTAVLSANAPAAGGPFTLFKVTASPVGGSGTAVSVSCALPADCALTGLKPGVTYDVTVVATGAGGKVYTLYGRFGHQVPRFKCQFGTHGLLSFFQVMNNHWLTLG